MASTRCAVEKGRPAAKPRSNWPVAIRSRTSRDGRTSNVTHLTVVKGYLRKRITNDRVARYLEQYQPELFIEFQKIAEMTSTLPSEAA
jgi:hypothetical protein